MWYTIGAAIWFVDLFLYSSTEVFFIFFIFSSFFFLGLFMFHNYYTSLVRDVVLSIRDLYIDIYKTRYVYSLFLKEFSSYNKEVETKDLVKKFEVLRFVTYRIRYLINEEILSYIKWYSAFKIEFFYLFPVFKGLGIFKYFFNLKSIDFKDNDSHTLADIFTFPRAYWIILFQFFDRFNFHLIANREVVYKKNQYDFFPNFFIWITICDYFYLFDWNWADLRYTFKVGL